MSKNVTSDPIGKLPAWVTGYIAMHCKGIAGATKKMIASHQNILSLYNSLIKLGLSQDEAAALQRLKSLPTSSRINSLIYSTYGCEVHRLFMSYHLKAKH